MNLILTGSSGFVGTAFISKTKDHFRVLEVDLLKQEVDDINFKNASSVLHLAALVHQMKGAPEDQYFKVNRDLAFQVAKKAKAEGVKQFVFMSTAKVFGESTTGKKAWNENSECNPVDSYGKSKFEAEKLLLNLEDDNFKVAIIRSPLVYGVGVKANMYNLIKLIHRFPILPFGGIHNKRSMIYVGNLIKLLEHIISMQASGIFIAADPEPLSTTRLAQLIIKNSNRKVILFKVPDFILKVAAKINPAIVDRLFGSLELDNSITNKKLNFVPPFEIENGIKEMVEWYELYCK